MSKDIPKGYVKAYMVFEDGKPVEVFYNPEEKDPLKAYIKRIVNG
jgi:thioredoxin-like negative regulator of GroEL